MATGYKRDSRGRFSGGHGAGALGGKGAYSGRSPRSGSARPPLKSSGGKASGSRRPTGSKQRGRRQLSSRHKKLLIGAGVGAAVGVAGTLAVRKALPSQRYSTSKLVVSGKMERITGMDGGKGSRVSDGPLTYSTYSSKVGKGLRAKTETNTVITRGNNPIGVITSYRRVGSRTNIVQGTYLVPANRKKGIGAKALTAHAAHDPMRNHRASMTRSIQGQAFAKSLGASGKRTSDSKKEGNKITSKMNSEFKGNKSQYAQLASNITAYSKVGQSSPVNLSAMKKSKKIKK